MERKQIIFDTMRLVVLIVSVLISVHGFTQSRSPVFVRVTPDGQTEIKTLPAFDNRWKRDRGDSVIFSVSSDPDYKTPPGQVRPVVEYFNRVHMSSFTWQESLDDFGIYPDADGYSSPSYLTWSDSLIHEGYNIDGSFCTVEYYYAIDQYWRYKNGQLVSVTATKSPGNDTSIRRYFYLDDNRFDRIEIEGQQGYTGTYHCTKSTIHFSYDDQKRLISVVRYTGDPLQSLSDSVAKWKSLIEAGWKGNKPPDFRTHRAPGAFIAGTFYSYNRDGLTNALAYSNSYTSILSDTLSYDKQGKLTRFVAASMMPGSEITTRRFLYTYDKKKLTGKSELVSSLGYGDQDRVSYEGTESYSYNPAGRISAIARYVTESKTTTTKYIHYP